ncbi:MAG: CsgG/HfaB family protein [Desulfomicrobium escambiense]|nr:CsgG/HfaB family protein [Desulfomicrobium escambiense]
MMKKCSSPSLPPPHPRRRSPAQAPAAFFPALHRVPGFPVRGRHSLGTRHPVGARPTGDLHRPRGLRLVVRADLDALLREQELTAVRLLPSAPGGVQDRAGSRGAQSLMVGRVGMLGTLVHHIPADRGRGNRGPWGGP